MPKPYVNDRHRQRPEGSPEFTRLLFVAFGIVMLLGLTSGVIWIVWNLIRLHVLR